MDLASIVGFVGIGAIIVIVLILDGGSPAELLAHPAAILLTLGGSIAAVTFSSPLKAVMLLPRLVMMTFQEKKLDTTGTIEILVKMADKARREGLLTLEDEAKKVTDTFMKKGIMMIVDGTDPAQVREILETNIHHIRGRHKVGYSLFSAAGGFAPTFGIIGTVMGLISVLKQLDDPNKLAKSIASAFLATLWGLLSANMIFLPIAAKLKSKSEAELAYKNLIMEGILSIQAGENPRILREKLSAFLPPATDKEKSATPAKAAAQKAPSKAEA